MRIAFRVDASNTIGIGHVMRCLTLADRLREHCAEISFLCRELPGNMNQYIEGKGYRVYRLDLAKQSSAEGWGCQTDAEQTRRVLGTAGDPVDWLVVDHYDIDERWEAMERSYAKKIMVIDDLANRRHDCEVLLDQNYYPNMEHRYDKLVPIHCRRLLGPTYALLRPEFLEVRKNMRQRHGIIERILVFFGGSDPTNETEKTLYALRHLNRPDIALDVVVGSANPQRQQMEKLCAEMPNAVFHCQISNMADLMAKADLAIGAGGASTWERCFLGLPTLTVIVADNQAETTISMAKAGAVWNLGAAAEVTSDRLVQALQQVLCDPAAVCEMGMAAQRIMGLDQTEGAAPDCWTTDYLADFMMHGEQH